MQSYNHTLYRALFFKIAINHRLVTALHNPSFYRLGWPRRSSLFHTHQFRPAVVLSGGVCTCSIKCELSVGFKHLIHKTCNKLNQTLPGSRRGSEVHLTEHVLPEIWNNDVAVGSKDINGDGEIKVDVDVLHLGKVGVVHLGKVGVVHLGKVHLGSNFRL